MSGATSGSGPYDEEYYQSHCGPPYRRGEGGWEAFFAGIADTIVKRFRPRTALDAGCAIGFLVEALRFRGVDAEGVDISEYAVSQVPEYLRPYVRVASIAEELPRDYDLIACIEVLEHVSEEIAEAAVANLARHTSRVLFSSTPDDHEEQTHVNVRPPEYWLQLFARHGFFRDLTVDASFVTPHALVFVRQDVGQFATAVESLIRSERESHAAEAASLRRSLEAAEREAAEWRAVRQTTAWRAFTQLLGLRARLAPADSLRDRALRKSMRRYRSIPRAPQATPVRPASPETGPVPSQAVLYLSGMAGDTFRYRCEHQAAGLVLAGGTAESALVSATDLDTVADRYAAFVLHRVAWDESIGRLVARARADGKPVIFDADDLVFDLDVVPFVDALNQQDEQHRRWFVDAVAGCRRTLSEVGAASVSTDPLRQAAAKLADPVVTVPNAIGDELVRSSAAARASAPRRGARDVVIAYLSGTATHDRDFLEAADAILWALDTYDNVRFLAVGLLRLDDRFEGVTGVERIPLQRWQDLPALMAGVDINLAPLEPENPFTEAKSCLKYLEAALLGVPTIASPRPDFARVIREGENGLLAETSGEWRDALELLIKSPERRASIGAAAYDDVRRNHTVRARARSQHAALASLLGRGDSSPLVVNWILGEGGRGDDTLIRLADELALRGHTVSVQDAGDEAFSPADVSIATDWRTAFAVAAHDESLFKAYLVQEYEPERYDEGDPQRLVAESAFDLPLRHICLAEQLAERLWERTGIPPDSIDLTVWAGAGAQLERVLAALAFVRFARS